MYSQNQEEQHILNYFQGQIGRLLDIGANDGKTLSNSRALLEQGWHGVLVEPSPSAFDRLSENSLGLDVHLIQTAIGAKKGKVEFHESGEHLGNGDTSLLSTLVKDETTRWGDTVEFKKIKVPAVTIAAFLESFPGPYDFITIDTEGMDWTILQGIDLTETQTRCVCIEHNGNTEMLNNFITYCAQHGLTKELYRSGENIILAK